MEQVLLSQSGKNVIVKSQHYINEMELQEIVKGNPGLINLSSVFQSPMMIIGRELERIDVLAITADAVPVIIECKRKDNPDMRYLIAQVFEYASNLSQKSYNEFDHMVAKYFSSERCQEDQYKGLTLRDAFNKFRRPIEADGEPYDENTFVTTVAEHLKNGEFLLIVVVDEISDVAFRTVQFLNSKMDKLRIEIIEVRKFGDKKQNVYVPSHANRESAQQKKGQPGKTTFEEMIRSSGTRQAAYIREFRETWEMDPQCTVVMGTKGFSARYDNDPILWVLPDYIQIAPRVKTAYGHLFPPFSQILKTYFSNSTEVTGKFDSPDFDSDKLRAFIRAIKDLLEKASNENTGNDTT